MSISHNMQNFRPVSINIGNGEFRTVDLLSEGGPAAEKKQNSRLSNIVIGSWMMYWGYKLAVNPVAQSTKKDTGCGGGISRQPA